LIFDISFSLQDSNGNTVLHVLVINNKLVNEIQIRIHFENK